MKFLHFESKKRLAKPLKTRLNLKKFILDNWISEKLVFPLSLKNKISIYKQIISRTIVVQKRINH